MNGSTEQNTSSWGISEGEIHVQTPTALPLTLLCHELKEYGTKMTTSHTTTNRPASSRGPETTPATDERTTTADSGEVGGIVYVASPMSTYDTPRYDRHLATIRKRFPQARILPARGQFENPKAWLQGWPRLLPRIAAVVVFPDDDGWIGWGTFQEIGGALARGLPVCFLDKRGTLWLWSDVKVTDIVPQNWRQYCRVTVPRKKQTSRG